MFWRDLLFYMFFSFLPIAFWLFICLFWDRSAPEPKREIFKVFLLGALVTFPLMLITGYLTFWGEKFWGGGAIIRVIVLSFLIDSLLEETGKYFLFRLGVYSRHHFNQVRDGFIYGMVLGLGFAFAENILYAFLSAENIWLGSSLILGRGLTATLLHFLTGGIIGYYWALAKFKSQSPFKGLVWVLLLHGLYNTIVRFNWSWSLIPLSILLIGVYLTIFRRIQRLAD
ncbi:PrsW family intramembrane metalloprotease [Patescibacteria group bacterium]|nr:PrsW family intramembrane metalloprotease [Patescibacteria group bacterium]